MYSSHGNGDILTSLFSVQLISKGVCIKLCLDEYIIISASQWEWLRDVESRQDEEDVAVFPLWDDIICWWMFPPQDECMCACVLGCTVGWCGLCECDYARCVVLKYAHTSPIPIHLCYLALLLQLIYNVCQPFLHIPHDAHTQTHTQIQHSHPPRIHTSFLCVLHWASQMPRCLTHMHQTLTHVNLLNLSSPTIPIYLRRVAKSDCCTFKTL